MGSCEHGNDLSESQKLRQMYSVAEVFGDDYVYHQHRHWQNDPFWVVAFLKISGQIWSGFHLFGFRNSIIFFTE
jgi:hypothetical protein